MKSMILRTDVPSLGKKHDIVPVDYDKMIDLLSKRQAYCDTPMYRRMFGIPEASPATV